MSTAPAWRLRALAVLLALPGLALAGATGAAGLALEPHAFGLGAVTVAIVLGVAVANLARPGPRFDPGLRACEKVLLAIAVALLGAELDLGTLARLGWRAAALVAGVVAGVTALGVLAARLFGLSRGLGILLGVGNGICGISAIAAAAPLVARDREDTGLSVSVVNLLGAVGIFLVPALARALALAADPAGLLVGASLQAVGHVVAAGFTLGEEVGRIATAVKMGRVALLGPAVLIIGWLAHRPADGRSRLAALKLPPYLWGFVACAAIANTVEVPPAALGAARSAGKLLLLVAMAGIGLQIRIASLVRQGPRALGAGAAVFAVQVAAIAALALAMAAP